MSDSSLPKVKNIFTTVADWNEARLDQIKINIALPQETTSSFTKERHPKKRYWKGGVSFSYNGATSRILKVSNCLIPSITKSNYGSEFVYAVINKAVAEAIKKAGLAMDLVVTEFDPRVVGSSDDWWATVNNVKDKIGIVSSDGNFTAVDVAHILESTGRGIAVNFDLTFSLKFSNETGENRKDHDKFLIVPECSRGYIKAMNQEVEEPQIETKVPTQRAAKCDVASQELIDALTSLGV